MKQSMTLLQVSKCWIVALLESIMFVHVILVFEVENESLNPNVNIRKIFQKNNAFRDLQNHKQ